MKFTKREPQSAASRREHTRAGMAAPRVRSDALLGASGELIIEHAGREYRLRQTSTGKLILTA